MDVDALPPFDQWLFGQLAVREWSQRTLARKVGVHHSAVGHWVAGRSVPDPPNSLKIAEAFGIEPDLVLAIAGHRPLGMPQDVFEQNQMLRAGRDILEKLMSVWQQAGTDIIRVPVLGTAAADHLRWTLPNWDIPYMEMSQSLVAGISNPALVVATGDCLLERGIRSGDIVVIDRNLVMPKDGEIVVVMVEGDITMKQWHRVTDGVELRASSDRYQPILIRSNAENVTVIGIARKVIANL